ncbi:MAG: HAD hydrolase-like protein, partial [Pseudomonadota bacterium]
MTRPATLVFDLDGTLVDTAPDLTIALNRVLLELGRRQVAVDEVRDMVGHGGRAMLEKGLAAAGAPIGQSAASAAGAPGAPIGQSAASAA